MSIKLEDCVRFLQKAIQTPSLPGEESEMAALVEKEMKSLGFDRVYQDEAGNVIGLIRGQGHVPSVMFNTHLDHVGVGDTGRWPYHPFAGEIQDDRVWGRGAVDIKGPLAAQVYGVARLIEQGVRPPGDVYVTAVVQEEVGGLGARYLAENIPARLVVVGEPSSNEVRRGHRGRMELVLHVKGRSVHASVPSRGVNPLEVVSRFVLALAEIDMPEDSDLGSSSVAPTLIRTDQVSANVVPSEVWLTCDWRNIPGESSQEVKRMLQHIADRCLIGGSSAQVEIPSQQRVSFTGYAKNIPAENPPFLLSANDPAIRAAKATLGDAIGLTAEAGVWRFATDGGHFAQAGMTVIGFGPGDEALAHTNRESIAVDELAEALAGNEALALEWAPKVALISRS